MQQQVDRGALTPDQARDHPLSHILTRALGTELSVEVDSYNAEVQSGDVFLLCSDGLSGMIPDDEIQGILSSPNENLEEVADALIRAANEAGGMDNITALVVKIVE